ncbi:hypothetical protein JMJ77_0010849 [Colletotrichum scovillei]|uniref:Uncharacterized protein n=1 Tax=Colletotrichum scovillei TaxID=1209932 RepID=A0A9P7UG79_9PEZI|nr:hypothetical protein JMJ77_0010849 [Colletotrichum scovillei]KAG7059814.1 hypothetical protein JMJ78_0015101 [Colletotrichum scovillei]KAG7067265.1 hypothetical protein JMJ76_0008705 [Colletotrichum scovillei]
MRGLMRTNGLWEQRNANRRRPLTPNASEIQVPVTDGALDLPQPSALGARHQNVSAVYQNSPRQNLNSSHSQRIHQKPIQRLHKRAPKTVKYEKTPDLDGLNRPLRSKRHEPLSASPSTSMPLSSQHDEVDPRVRWIQDPRTAKLLNLFALSIRPTANCIGIGPLVTQFDSSCPISLLSKAVALSFGLRPIPWRPGGHLNVITKFGIFQPKEYTTGIVQACGLVDGDLGKCNVALVDDEELRPWGFQFLAAEKIVDKLLEKDSLLSQERARIDLGFHRTSPKQSSAVPQTQAQSANSNDRYISGHLQPATLDQASSFSTSYTAGGNPSGFSTNDAGPISTPRTSFDDMRLIRGSMSDVRTVNGSQSLCDQSQTHSHDGGRQTGPFGANSSSFKHNYHGQEASNSSDAAQMSLTIGNGTMFGASSATNGAGNVKSPVLARHAASMQTPFGPELERYEGMFMGSASGYCSPDGSSYQAQVAIVQNKEIASMSWQNTEPGVQSDEPGLLPAIQVTSSPADDCNSIDPQVLFEPDMGIDPSFFSF